MEGDRWRLYDMATDRCEMVDIATEYPAKPTEMVSLWQDCEDTYRGDSGHNA